MQENEFEKRLQEEMGEFRLRPSDDVWSKIDVQLRKKKRRRVVFFIFLLAGLSLLSTGYFLFTSDEQTLTEKDVATTDKNILDKKNEEPTNANAQKSILEDQIIAKQVKEKKEVIVPSENKTVQGAGELIVEKKSRHTKRPAESNKTGLAKNKE